MTDPLFPSSANYQTMLDSLKHRIRTAQVKAAWAINKELILLYWQIGREILTRQQSDGWGSKVIQRLATDLRREFPSIKGFSRSNLMYMRAFAETYPDEPIVQAVLGQIPWYHNIALLDKLNDNQERLWYAHETQANGWSRNVLVLQIASRLYQRQGGATTNFQHTLPAPQSDLAQQIIKDPYNFDFLNLTKESQERDLERALMGRIRDFLLELGVGFAFVGSQYRLEVEGDEYFIDLLFYHLKLKCYIVIDLKITEFKPEHSGKMNFYVAAVNKLLRDDIDRPTIGIILCRSKKKTIVEYALETLQNPIGVATYTLKGDLPPTLQAKLPTVEQLEMEFDLVMAQLEAQQDIDTEKEIDSASES
jgi:predicted nuclease of restriction endonuclease-like (RecB) superfamily